MAVHQHSPSNLMELERICKEEWQRIPTSSLQQIEISPVSDGANWRSLKRNLSPPKLKIISQQQSFWTHVSSDACRLALIGKYGGIYMDTDFISIQTIPFKDFLAAESSQYTSNGIFGFSPHHDFTQKCLEDFVKNYDSRIWGQQGPRLFTRILKTFCNLPQFVGYEDAICGNNTLLNPHRFYPIICPEWKKYYEVWDKFPSFNDSYSLHLWNFMNKEKLTMVPGSKTLVEHLYKQYCPFTYNATFS
ncbi:unnamed protein product [Ranitomeya imitator]|uniref:Alpha 1,4-glycosyltransferase domain-containing protein n=1 Tax=Ranitomeya imitator TaxID=111125 RepID=A0ABN9MNB9_9NEOB|nr:unnamed protein product [Ranitomeya imitator]